MTAVTRSAQKRKASSTTTMTPEPLQQQQHPSSSRLFRTCSSVSSSSSNKKKIHAHHHHPNEEDKRLKNLPTTTITANDINQRVAVLFPGDDEVIQGPCILARIFAAYSLVINDDEQQRDEDDWGVVFLTGPQQAAHATQHADIMVPPQQHNMMMTMKMMLTPILPLLQSLVMVESISLAGGSGGGGGGGDDNDSDGSSSSSSTSSSKNLVSFSGIDCSSVQPPVDRVGGSGTHQHDSIQALVQAKEQVEALVRQVRDNDNNNDNDNGSEEHYGNHAKCNTNTCHPQIRCLESLVEFLRQADGWYGKGSGGHHVANNNNTGSSSSSSSTAGSWVHECAKAIHPTFPPRRVHKAVALCQQELLLILKRLYKNNKNNNSNDDDEDASSALMLEKRLSELVGQAIRYHLRLFFNSAPPRLSPKDVEYEHREQQYSQVKNLIVMTMKDDYSNGAVDDECISALVSNALCRICEYFGLHVLLDASAQCRPPHVPALFCTNPASNRGFRVRGGSPASESLSMEELDQVLSDIDHAYAFLAMTNACRFLVELLNAPGVQDEIDRQGGWSQLETYASISWKHQLWKLCPDDQHLVCLCNFEVFKERLQIYLSVLEGCIEGCEESLAALAKRFHTSTKNKNILGKFPQIRIIAHCLEDGRQRAYAFPRVKSALK